ncbi:MAG: inositol-1-monophosphatase [Pseudomonadota bacterium]|nr:inositol-1-monophosphatase [Pseudomonadota bacterium]
MHPLVTIAENAARSAGQIIVRAADRLDRVTVTEKSANDFVTDIDQEAEQEIIGVIHKAYPNHSILSEESGAIGEDHEIVWIVDPLDGTRNFINGLPHFCVSIAVQIRGKIEHGVIYDPIRDETFTASRGRGAKLNNTRLRISQRTKLEKALVGTGFPFRNTELTETYLNMFTKVFPQTGDIRRGGSAALDLAYVAAGRLDAFWEMDLKIWDIAAGSLLIKEAGGLVSDFTGSENYLESGNIVAGNPKLFKALLQLIAS